MARIPRHHVGAISLEWRLVRYVSLLWICQSLEFCSYCQALSSLTTEQQQQQQQQQSAELDRQTVKEQLGYLPRNYLCVSARNVEGSPIAIKTYPLQQQQQYSQKKNHERSIQMEEQQHEMDISAPPATWGTPFPTHYWLTCPDISRAIGDIERLAYTRVIADYLNLDANLDQRQQLLRCHKQCGEDRWASLLPPHRDFFQRYAEDYSTVGRMQYFIKDSGIAGLNYQEKLDEDGLLADVAIKCLHTHYAHFCSTSPDRRVNNAAGRLDENPIGRITHDLLVAKSPSLSL